MTRKEAILALHRHYGTATALELIDRLQLAGLISDNVIEPKEAATCDLVAAAEALT